MATFPSGVLVMLMDGYGEEFDPSIERTEMERGAPKQRRLNTQVMDEISVRLMFTSKADVDAFDAWYFDTIERIGWFDFTHPRTGAVIKARFKEASIGRLEVLIPDFSYCYRDVVLEYMR